MSYEAWRIAYQSSESAARAAYKTVCDMQSRIEALEKDAARYARLPLAEWQDLEYWLDRCYEKGHLENCYDLIAPYENLCAAAMQSEKGGV